ncbi:TetR family transcriptional regulator C-terminal domain-containing protein [Mesorhizobium sp. M1348]|uniref:TetR family transcriptional regulator C-terminal domain-containing protein n=1 Tax=Mesorhizobium sp. M1348 TaxID=2957089 RepID=UPI003338FB4C
MADHAAWLEQVKTCIAGLSQRSASLSKQEMEDQAEELIALINGMGIRAVLEPKAWPARRQIASLNRYLTRAGLNQKLAAPFLRRN